MKDDYTTNSHYISFGKTYFLNFGVKGLKANNEKEHREIVQRLSVPVHYFASATDTLRASSASLTLLLICLMRRSK